MNSSPSPDQTPTEGGFSIAAATFLRGVVRLLVILLLGGLLGLGIFFGIPYLYNQFILPVEQNSVAVDQLQKDQSEFEQVVAGQLSGLQQRIQDLESYQDETRETLSELQASIDALQADVEAVSVRLDAQSEAFSSLQEDMTEIQQALTRLEQQLTRLATASRNQQQQLDELQTAMAENGTPIREIQTELEILKTLQILTRARLFLGRSDIDLAREELRLVRTILENLAENSTPEQADFFRRVLVRLGLAESNLIEAPLLAGEDVEISYRLLLGRLVPTSAVVSQTPAEATPALQVDSTPRAGTPTPTAPPRPDITATATP